MKIFCRLFGHRWRPMFGGLVCTRCTKFQYSPRQGVDSCQPDELVLSMSAHGA